MWGLRSEGRISEDWSTVLQSGPGRSLAQPVGQQRWLCKNGACVCVRALERMCICQGELATERGCCTRGWDSGRLKAEMFCPLPRSLMRNKRGRPAAFIGRRVKRILFVQRRTLEHIIFRWKGRSYWERKGKWLKMRVQEQRKRKNGTTLQRAPLHYTTH